MQMKQGGCSKDLQGISYWSVKSNSAMRGRRIIHFIELWFIVGLRGLEIWVSSTSFQKSNMGWPQQPPTEKVLKFNLILHDSTQKLSFSKHQCKAEFKILDDSEVLSSDFPGLKNLCSLNDLDGLNNLSGLNDLDSLISSKKNTHPDGWIIPTTKMTNTSFFLRNRPPKIQLFPNIWYPFCRRLWRPAYVTFLKTGWWNSNFQTSWTRYES